MKKYFYGETGQKILLYFLAFCFFVAILPTVSFFWDVSYWFQWTEIIHDFGFAGLYNNRTEYHPIFLYCLNLFLWVMGNMAEVETHINYVKVFPLIFDFVGALSIFLIVKDKKNVIIYPFFLLFNIAYMYNTMVWGQIDSIHSAFILLSIIFALKTKPLLSIFFFMLALNTKLQAIIFLPIIGLLLLPQFIKSIPLIFKSFLLILITQIIILLPMILGDTLGGFWKVVKGAEGRHPFISMNAFNIWYYFVDGNPNITEDTSIFALGTSYKTWGRILFLSTSFLVLFPLLKTTFIKIKTRIDILSKDQLQELVFISAGLITLVFFYFNTQMHERYSHPAMLFFFFYGLKSNRYFLYILTSIAYLLNMERVLKAWDIDNYHTIIFEATFISTLFLIIIIIGIQSCYKILRQKT